MANTVFDNKVISSYAKEVLNTIISARNLMTIDTELTEKPGQVRTVNAYTYTGNVQELAEGVGNSQTSTIAYVGKDYRVKTNQQKFSYTDEQIMKDDKVLGYAVDGAAKAMANKMFDDFLAALALLTAQLPILSHLFPLSISLRAASLVIPLLLMPSPKWSLKMKTTCSCSSALTILRKSARTLTISLLVLAKLCMAAKSVLFAAFELCYLKRLLVAPI